MILLFGSALAEPCVYTGATEDTPEAGSLTAAWDNDETTWSYGTNFALGLKLDGNQVVETVGVMVKTDSEVAFDLDVWYLPYGETVELELLALNGTLPPGENRGTWQANQYSEELEWSMLTSNSAEEPVGFQVLCESGPVGNFQGGGGCTCDGNDFGLRNYSFLVVFPFLLRRRRA